MAGTKEIKGRIQSVRETGKITNAMYLIASTKMRKAREELANTRPYFEALRGEIKRVFRTANGVESRYFYPTDVTTPREGTYGCLVVTADKGLAGAYNQNVVKETQKLLSEHPDTKLFVVGEYGRHIFAQRGIPVEQSFLYTAQNPTLERAREICDVLLDGYESGELTEIFVIYTDLENRLTAQARSTRLLGGGRAGRPDAQLHRGLHLQRPGGQLLRRAERPHDRHGRRQPQRGGAAEPALPGV